MTRRLVRILIAAAVLALLGLYWADLQQMREAEAGWGPTEAEGSAEAEGVLEDLSVTTTTGDVVDFTCSASASVLVAAGRTCMGVLREARADERSVVRIEYVRRDCGLKPCNVLLSLRDRAGHTLISRKERLAVLDRGKRPPEAWYWAMQGLISLVTLLFAAALAVGWWPRRDGLGPRRIPA